VWGAKGVAEVIDQFESDAAAAVLNYPSSSLTFVFSCLSMGGWGRPVGSPQKIRIERVFVCLHQNRQLIGPSKTAARKKHSPVGFAPLRPQQPRRKSANLFSLPKLNSPNTDTEPAITADGRYIAFVSERLDSTGERDIYIYDRQSSTLLPTPNLNSPMDEYDPCIIHIGTDGK